MDILKVLRAVLWVVLILVVCVFVEAYANTVQQQKIFNQRATVNVTPSELGLRSPLFVRLRSSLVGNMSTEIWVNTETRVEWVVVYGNYSIAIGVNVDKDNKPIIYTGELPTK